MSRVFDIVEDRESQDNDFLTSTFVSVSDFMSENIIVLGVGSIISIGLMFYEQETVMDILGLENLL